MRSPRRGGVSRIDEPSSKSYRHGNGIVCRCGGFSPKCRPNRILIGQKQKTNLGKQTTKHGYQKKLAGKEEKSVAPFGVRAASKGIGPAEIAKHLACRRARAVRRQLCSSPWKARGSKNSDVVDQQNTKTGRKGARPVQANVDLLKKKQRSNGSCEDRKALARSTSLVTTRVLSTNGLTARANHGRNRKKTLHKSSIYLWLGLN